MTTHSLDVTPEQAVVLMHVGLSTWRLVYTVQQLGWASPRGGLPYFHVDTPAVDIARWTAGDQAAGDRLKQCLPEWKDLVRLRPDLVIPRAS